MGYTSRAAGALVAALAFSACASTPDRGATLSGVLVEGDGDRPAAGVLVTLDGGQRTHTDARGRFVFEDVAPGRHELTLLGRNCERSLVTVDTRSDDELVIGVRAGYGAHLTRFQREEPPTNSPGRVYTAGDIAEMHANTMLDVLRKVAPYMISGSTGQVGRHVRLRGRGGQTPADARIPVVVVDGVQFYLNDTGVLEAIRAADIAWVEILPGTTGGVRYDTDGAGGVISIRTQRGGVVANIDPSDCVVT